MQKTQHTSATATPMRFHIRNGCKAPGGASEELPSKRKSSTSNYCYTRSLPATGVCFKFSPVRKSAVNKVIFKQSTMDTFVNCTKAPRRDKKKKCLFSFTGGYPSVAPGPPAAAHTKANMPDVLPAEVNSLSHGVQIPDSLEAFIEMMLPEEEETAPKLTSDEAMRPVDAAAL